jgi:hypothetical protein
MFTCPLVLYPKVVTDFPEIQWVVVTGTPVIIGLNLIWIESGIETLCMRA